MILFTEPSHYALFFSPFLLYKSYMEFNKRKKNLFIYLLLTFFIAILVENVTLLVGLIATLVVLYATKLRYFLPIVIAMIFFVINSEYFSTRMSLSTEVSNLSVLVYLSGWERAYLALIDSYGLGLGFQQMGIGLEGIFMESLSKAGAGGLNYNDGGTLGSKIVAELGFLGIAFLIMYIKVGVHIFLSMIKNTGHLTSKVVFFNSIYLMMSLSIFIRAAGYFNSISLMFLLSLIWIDKEDKSYFKEL